MDDNLKRFSILGFIILLSHNFVFCQDKSEIRPYFVSIIVADFEKSIKWYEDVFALQTLNKVINDERGFKQANLGNSEFLLELIYLQTATSRSQQVTGFFKFGIRVNKFDDWIKRLRDLKVEFNGDIVEDPVSGKKMVVIKDPDGNRIQLFSM